ncbi:cytochrome P450 7B1 [Phascolarctos cinereus]|uniref:25-hydroxycholesterol 7-alpha-hydroxylase n=1 Tax=Phascolarctos cinereus TaxID=38626 RepID=A0A6P5LI26_PHACI|nr:25-hydroxycholesterol 7-alpha-hydroxylase [Phascolarctos cinereus]
MGPSWLQWLLKHLLCLPGLAIATILLLVALGVRGRRRRRPGEPPLINGLIPFFGVSFQIQKNTFKCLQDYQKKYGNTFTLQINGNYFTFVLDPFQYPLVLKNHKQFNFNKFGKELARKVFLLPNETPRMEKTMREGYKYLKSNFLDLCSYNLMQNLQHIMKEQLLQAKNGEKNQLYKFCTSIIFEATYLTLYGKDPGTNSGEVIHELMEDFVKFDDKFLSFLSPLPTWSLRAAKDIREKLIQNFSSERISKMQGISEVVRARQILLEQFTELQDYERGAHHFIFLWASVANTIPATFWTMYYLLQHPEAVAVLRDEVDHLLQSTGQKKEPDFNILFTREQLDSLVYLESSINETLRMASVSSNVRFNEEDITLNLGNGEVNLRKGDLTIIYPPFLHYDPEIFEQPEEFKFDRFVEDGKKKTTFFKRGQELPYFLIPFGSGISKCPGRFLAVLQIKQFIILFFMYFDAELIEDKPPKFKNSRILFGIQDPQSDVSFRYKLRC